MLAVGAIDWALLHEGTWAFEITIPDDVRGVQIERHEGTCIIISAIVGEGRGAEHK